MQAQVQQAGWPQFALWTLHIAWRPCLSWLSSTGLLLLLLLLIIVEVKSRLQCKMTVRREVRQPQARSAGCCPLVLGLDDLALVRRQREVCCSAQHCAWQQNMPSGSLSMLLPQYAQLDDLRRDCPSSRGRPIQIADSSRPATFPAMASAP